MGKLPTVSTSAWAGETCPPCAYQAMNPMSPISSSPPLLADVRLLINAARQRVASTVNTELTQLYWQIGKRVNSELLQGQRAEYGKQVIIELAKQLTTEFGKGCACANGCGATSAKMSKSRCSRATLSFNG